MTPVLHSDPSSHNPEMKHEFPGKQAWSTLKMCADLSSRQSSDLLSDQLKTKHIYDEAICHRPEKRQKLWRQQIHER